MKPLLALKILRYTKIVAAEHDVIEKLRLAMVYEITGAQPGTEIKLEPETREFKEYLIKLQEILAVETNLKPIELDFKEVVKSVDEKDESLSISDLAALEPFFVCPD
jgi:type III secretory pathway component EscV